LKILVTGGAGFIGRHLVKNLIKNNQILVYDNLSNSSDKDRISLVDKGVKFLKGDILDYDVLCEFSKNVNVVIHLAAKSGLGICENNPSDAFSVNVFGTFNVIKACQECNSKLIFLSSREVYGEKSSKKILETEKLNPTNVYGETKSLAELLIKNKGKISKLDYTILRPTNIYGPKGSKGINQIFKMALNKRKIIVNGGEQLINPIYIDDIIKAINQVINEKKSYQQIFNLGSEETFKLKIIAKKISEYLKNVQIIYTEKPKFENQNFIPNNKKIKKILNFKAETKFDQGLENTIKWFEDEK